MTREDAINIMKVIVHMLEEKYDTERVEDAVNMAIKPLEQEPCEDAISRQEAIQSIGKYFLRVETNGTIEIHQKLFSEFLKAINETQKKILLDLPSVHPKAKVGKWIPVSERLPLFRLYKVSDDVLITNGYEIDMGYLVERKGKIFWHYYGGDIEVGIKDEDNDAIAWMPLPKPYKAESELKEE